MAEESTTPQLMARCTGRYQRQVLLQEVALADKMSGWSRDVVVNGIASKYKMLPAAVPLCRMNPCNWAWQTSRGPDAFSEGRRGFGIIVDWPLAAESIDFRLTSISWCQTSMR
ncbi:MAG: hypothetical protein OWU32_11870 [Firmicutes bacterium]|nr:hypothetical protein [Bacillota bacterium]